VTVARKFTNPPALREDPERAAQRHAEVEPPTPEDGEMLVRVRATTVNRTDARRGRL